VLELVAQGAGNAEIARRLHIADATVKSHLVHVFTKLGVASRTAAVNAARSQGMLR
jgi:ATP/maltotriose-dependent transcriptional regulator MalT